MSSLPHVKKPCADCPMRKDSMKGWLGAERMIEILNQDSFVCHKKQHLQCAGHMLLLGKNNSFVALADRLKIKLELSGRGLIFNTPMECVGHHE